MAETEEYHLLPVKQEDISYLLRQVSGYCFILNTDFTLTCQITHLLLAKHAFITIAYIFLQIWYIPLNTSKASIPSNSKADAQLRSNHKKRSLLCYDFYTFCHIVVQDQIHENSMHKNYYVQFFMEMKYSLPRVSG